jgi:hypothetical protein
MGIGGGGWRQAITSPIAGNSASASHHARHAMQRLMARSLRTEKD